MRHRTLAGASTAIAALGASLAFAIPEVLAKPSSRSASHHTVVLKNIRFNPATLSIRRGDTVTWIWSDGSTRHNVTGGGFRSRTMSHGSFSVRFTRKGTFSYRCTIRASLGMRGKIVVH